MSIIRRLVLTIFMVAAIAVVPRSPANAQYDCSFPLTWPFCIAGAAVYTAGAIATAPFRPYYYDPYYYNYYNPAYYSPGYYYPHYHHYHHHHHARHHYY
jgi:hypothetical protein